MTYIKNPKTEGSGILACIPQKDLCPMKCPDCFFQSGRSYLEPLDTNLPNLPSKELAENRIIRVNDGNDSNNDINVVLSACKDYKFKFYNTSIPKNFDKFDAPVVLTLNPSSMTDKNFHKLEIIPKNLMFVRFRTNTWNLSLLDEAVIYYTQKQVPVVLTFMAYYNENIPEEHKKNYIFRKRTLNSYNAIKSATWNRIMQKYKYNYYVYSCGKVEGEKGKTKCERCGNCIREYFSTTERFND